MTDVEYEQILNQLRYLKKLMERGYRYVVRSESGVLTVFKNKPRKEVNFWYCGFYGIKYEKDIDKSILEEISWKDESPQCVKSLYKELMKKHKVMEGEI